ncbi:MAG: carboxylating nicotinate-nucleotide diphosphorylase [Mariprofundaceae bacterium]
MTQNISHLQALVTASLSEDATAHDITGAATIPAGQAGHAVISAKAAGVLSGVQAASMVFEAVDADIRQQWRCGDGDGLRIGDIVCELSGAMQALLAAERTALNFLQHLSGIASHTASFVTIVADTDCQIIDTRKTTPGLRALEKQAVLHGGGINHRMDLAGGMLIKENHNEAAGSITRAVAACREQSKEAWIEVECESLEEVAEAVAARPDIILLDNMSVNDVRRARALVPNTIILEASGGITLESAHAYADTGVDRLAVGEITHSAPALDLSMRVTRA